MNGSSRHVYSHTGSDSDDEDDMGENPYDTLFGGGGGNTRSRNRVRSGSNRELRLMANKHNILASEDESSVISSDCTASDAASLVTSATGGNATDGGSSTGGFPMYGRSNRRSSVTSEDSSAVGLTQFGTIRRSSMASEDSSFMLQGMTASFKEAEANMPSAERRRMAMKVFDDDDEEDCSDQSSVVASMLLGAVEEKRGNVRRYKQERGRRSDGDIRLSARSSPRETANGGDTRIRARRAGSESMVANRFRAVDKGDEEFSDPEVLPGKQRRYRARQNSRGQLITKSDSSPTLATFSLPSAPKPMLAVASTSVRGQGVEHVTATPPVAIAVTVTEPPVEFAETRGAPVMETMEYQAVPVAHAVTVTEDNGKNSAKYNRYSHSSKPSSSRPSRMERHFERDKERRRPEEGEQSRNSRRSKSSANTNSSASRRDVEESGATLQNNFQSRLRVSDSTYRPTRIKSRIDSSSHGMPLPPQECTIPAPKVGKVIISKTQK